MPGFDADAWQAAHERWAIQIDGREYLAREVSAEQVIAAQLQLQGASAVASRTILLGLLRLAFPKTYRMRWYPGCDPVYLIERLPVPAFNATVCSFFAYVTGNPVTSQVVLGPSPTTSSSGPSDQPAAPAAPPMP